MVELAVCRHDACVCAHAWQLFISLDHEKSAYGTCSPGPCTASVEAAASIRRLSTQRQASAWGFGTSRRLPQDHTESPGPGQYYA